MSAETPPSPFDQTNELPVREMLRLSQTNVTHNPEEGLTWATWAYYASMQPDVRADDPTATSEAAAKAAFRATQADRDDWTIANWIERANHFLPADADNAARAERESISIDSLEGRSFALRALQLKLGRTSHSGNADEAETRAKAAFESAEAKITAQHEPGTAWDPYAPMASRHRATLMAVRETREKGDTTAAVRVAAGGIARAIRSRQETANTPRGALKHALFVGKQVLSSAEALGLAASRPFDRVAAIKWARSRVAYHMLG